jgi:tRNA A-37 threonylcarbamoyl transferase component Bud32
MPYADPLGLVGQHLGPYVVRELATAGGVALIYRGEHEALKSAVAVKVLRPELVEEGVRPTLEQMFLREAQILSQLRSDDILRALDHGRVVCPGDGAERPYIVVDWLEGMPLVEDLERRALERERRPYTLPEALDLLEPVARALAVCHEAGIVHRDVNPRNVFLETLGAGKPPRAKLIDFGFAKEVARTEALRLARVDATLFARSPDYAAPEHYDREAFGELSENTDIYTFALMLVQMLTLEPPLRGATDEELKAATTNREDRPTPNNRGAHVSPEIESLFREALAIDQFERPGILWDFWLRLREAAAPVPLPAADAAAPGPETSQAPFESADAAGPFLNDVPEAASSRRRGGGAKAVFIALSVLVLGAAGAFAVRWSRQPLACPPGFADCNGDRADGCEADLRGDSANCGACRRACSADGTQACTDGQCRIAKCAAPNLADCNHAATDGCETDLATDEKNCGACGRTCSAEGVKEARCAASKCQSVCRTGYGDCDEIASNGCEASLTSDAKNCGRCGVSCGPGAECKDGLCAAAVLASPVGAHYLAVFQGAAYYWDEQTHGIERVAANGERSTVVASVPGVTALGVGGGRVVWGTPDHSVFTRPLDDASAAAVRFAGPLASDTPLSVSGTGYVSWVNRLARAAPLAAGRHGASQEPVPPGPLRRVFSAPLESLLEKGKTGSVECPLFPLTFAADGAGAYCCDGAKPLTRIDCAHGRCTNDPYDALCPEALAMDADRLYFAQDVRVLALDRKTGKLKALAKRKRRPRDVTLGGGFLYWLEGDRAAEVWRIAADPAIGGVPEILSRRQIGVTALSADDAALYFVGDAPLGTSRAIYRLPVAPR